MLFILHKCSNICIYIYYIFKQLMHKKILLFLQVINVMCIVIYIIWIPCIHFYYVSVLRPLGQLVIKSSFLLIIGFFPRKDFRFDFYFFLFKGSPMHKAVWSFYSHDNNNNTGQSALLLLWVGLKISSIEKKSWDNGNY